jgi:RAD50-interacting protein 1
MENDMQSILNETGFKRIAMVEFIAALHPILERKIDHILPELLGNGYLLSHFVHEALSFDRKLREEYLFVPHGRDHWEGIAQYALRSSSAFKAWQKTEKDCNYACDNG